MRRRAGLTLIAGGLALSAISLLGSAGSATPPRPEHKVTLCHATDSYSNPYVVVTVDVASVLHHGHDGHDGPVFYATIPKHQKWGDIIPSFDYGPGERYGGKNNNGAAMTMLGQGCKPSKPTWPPPPPTTCPPKTTTTAPHATTTAPYNTTTTAPNGSTTTSTPVEETTTSSVASSTTVPGSTTSTTTPHNTTTTGVTVVTLGTTTTSVPNASTTVVPTSVVGSTTTTVVPPPEHPGTGAATTQSTLLGLVVIGAGVALLRKRPAYRP